MLKKDRRRIFTIPVILAAVFVVGLLVLEYGRELKLAARGQDNKPAVDFTWTPIGRVSLKDMVGTVRLQDDYALDFSTYNIEVVELNRVIGLPIEGVIGRDYEQQVSFAMFDGNLDLLKRGQMTLRVSVADDAGQVTEIERVVKLALPDGVTQEMLSTLKLITE